ncbi:hypothetical protein TrST_g7726 [Triparma strigata]|uniref:S-adenosyl-L-methionine-dependent methyltransferase n=1 Tax=Triparma strigata TaxID=1606541 RepID=A0A9W6ZWX8_9STRA|nr:hypothetical protein TrST_g7726 [Triparma strigata]
MRRTLYALIACLFIGHRISSDALRQSSFSFKRRGTSPQYNAASAADAARKLSLAPPLTAPKFVWKMAWNTGKFALKVLPYTTRSYVPVDSNVNLSVLYWKSIGGDGTARKMLPGSFSRLMTSRAGRLFFPRLHHQNVKIRSEYIDTRLREIIEETPEEVALRICIVGAGFDSRGVKLIEENSNNDNGNDNGRDIEVYEFDLPGVIEEKRIVLSQSKLAKDVVDRVNLREIDLNNLETARGVLLEVVRGGGKEGKQRVVVVLEAVIIYVDDPTAVLNLLGEVLHDGNARDEGEDGDLFRNALVFADRLPKESVSYANEEEARSLLGGLDWGLELTDFMPKPGLASSMGVAQAQAAQAQVKIKEGFVDAAVSESQPEAAVPETQLESQPTPMLNDELPPRGTKLDEFLVLVCRCYAGAGLAHAVDFATANKLPAAAGLVPFAELPPLGQALGVLWVVVGVGQLAASEGGSRAMQQAGLILYGAYEIALTVAAWSITNDPDRNLSRLGAAAGVQLAVAFCFVELRRQSMNE